jgi:catechol 2,3-dioxygenase-like lactoylglutathione lyase family enzyme
MLRNFNSVQLLVRDVGVSVAFYGDVIGMDINYEEPHFAIVAVGDFRIVLHTEPEPARRRNTNRADGQPRKGEGATLQFEVEDVDAFHQALVEQGVSPLTEPTDQAWGWREFAVADPDGYRLVFWSQPSVSDND